ncbi:ABC transporter permease [Panacibacter ginsenosidivorans]|uniref:ABC transporter permease n=1 Tax=Panacibacter ginsenosidivorans TaxID=1813871 RepID=A0A5B8V5Z6_9BACT|nr:ABC transporter permease [Panacibacter ginsenosidivorans]QEC66824.1 ABC transporter permease [Panacibacter ginsenosidivorans]
MNKILLIARREFLTRVQKKTFLLTTILLPLIIFGFYAMIIYFSVHGGSSVNIAVADNAHIFDDSISKTDDANFSFVKANSAEELRQQVTAGKYDGYIFVPASIDIAGKDSIQLVSAKSIGLISRGSIQDVINNKLEEKRMLALNISKAQLDSVHRKNEIKFSTISGSEDSDAKAGISYVVGMISGFLIYIILFIYGTMVMRGVMEEKVSRIAEVIVSSVKPFQLMMGKIIGIGAVGLVQFLIWIVLVVGTRVLLFSIFPELSGAMPGASAAQQVQASDVASAMHTLGQINWPMIIGCFIFYFLGGYLLYSSLFAAVGSAVNEDPQDAQSLTLPIIMPIIFAIVIMMKAVNDPSSGLAIFGSLFPLTSPIVMMARIAHGVPDTVPYWQLITSMLLLILGFLGTTWVAAKIYRTGILLYGKKVTPKEMWKWAFRKN